MNLENYFRQTEKSKILEEISSESPYQKELGNYYNAGLAEGYIGCMKMMTKEERIKIIDSIKEVGKKKDSKICEYILRLYNDEFKVLDLK